MPSAQDLAAQLDVVEPGRVPHEAGYAEGADRVEHTEEVHLGRMAVVVLELVDTRPEGAAGQIRALVHADRRGQPLLDQGTLVSSPTRPTMPATERAV